MLKIIEYRNKWIWLLRCQFQKKKIHYFGTAASPFYLFLAVRRTQEREQRNMRIGIRVEGISTEQPLEIQGVLIKGEPPL